ncbi:MAG: SDR family oxidoreductase [Planctomycetaceae bacterium]|jgi:3-oxoacyl-[acyl-carrier protein] reductase|nr:SDR family oxidoreductase [Planctomycetaceae bacterium]
MLLKGKNVIVTGCNRGIGKAILKTFAENGVNVWACARKNSDEFDSFVKELAEKNNVEIRPVFFDLTDNEEIKSAIKTISSQKINIDVLVNNAGIVLNALFQMTPIAKFNEVFQVNFFAPVLLTQYISKLMIKSGGGSIINIASTAGSDPERGYAAYGASKAAIISVTKIMAIELGEHLIRVNAIAPGITDTAMVADNMPETTVKETIDSTMLKRMGEPSEIADVVFFLASDLSSYVTGQVLRVDGGLY